MPTPSFFYHKTQHMKPFIFSLLLLAFYGSLFAQMVPPAQWLPAPAPLHEPLKINKDKDGANPVFSGSIQDALSHAFDSVTALSPIKGFSAAMYLPNGSIWKKTSGIRQELPAALPLTTENLLGMGSISKSFVTVTLLKMMEDGLLSLNDTIGKYIGPYPNVPANATIRQLLSHRTGINDYLNENPATNVTLVQNLDSIWNIDTMLYHFVLKPNFPLDSSWSYSNTNYLLAGRIIEKISGKHWYEELRNRVLTPLGLTHTFSYPFELPGSLLLSHAFSDQTGDGVVDDVQGIGIPDQGIFSLAASAGCLITTPSDLVVFDQNVYGGSFLKPATLLEMETDHVNDPSTGIKYGLGTMQYLSLGGLQNWGHNGSLIYQSNAFHFPDLGISLAVQQNDDSGWTPTAPIVDGNDVFLSLLIAFLEYDFSTATHDRRANQAAVKIYPNPAIERFQLQSDGWSSDVVYAEIYNNLGIMVQNRQIAVNNQAINAEIDLSGNAPGVYTLRLRDAQNRQTSQKISLVK